MIRQPKAFSYSLVVGGSGVYTTLGDIEFSQSVNGYGLSGLLTSMFTVALPSDGFSADDGAPVQLLCSDSNITLPNYYISSRNVTGNKVVLNCVDDMQFADQTCSIAENAFTDDKISITLALDYVATQMGLDDWGGGNSAFHAIQYLSKVDVFQAKCSAILEMVATAGCGCWYISHGTTKILMFRPFANSATQTSTSALKHTAIVLGNTKTITSVALVGSDETFIAGTGTARQTIVINTPLASAALVSALYARLNGYTYTAWECTKTLIQNYMPIDTLCVFGSGQSLISTHSTIKPSISGLFCSCGSQEVTEDEYSYSGALDRKIDSKVGKGDAYDVYVYDN